jgi:hypothetical protein
VEEVEKGMKRIGTISGIAIIIMVLTSGSAFGTWYYAVSVYDYEDCTDPSNALYAPDNNYTSLGKDDTEELGWIRLDFGFFGGVPPGGNFTVFSNSLISENYSLILIATDGKTGSTGWYGLSDTSDQELQAPLGYRWRFVEIRAEDGVHGDYGYGPDIDAVGYEI